MTGSSQFITITSKTPTPLYEELLQNLSGIGLHGAYAGVALPNDASVKLHEALGFRKVGLYQEVGRKFGKYWNVAWYEKRIQG